MIKRIAKNLLIYICPCGGSTTIRSDVAIYQSPAMRIPCSQSFYGKCQNFLFNQDVLSFLDREKQGNGGSEMLAPRSNEAEI